MKAYKWTGGTVPVILKLGTRWWVVYFKDGSPYPRKRTQEGWAPWPVWATLENRNSPDPAENPTPARAVRNLGTTVEKYNLCTWVVFTFCNLQVIKYSTAKKPLKMNAFSHELQTLCISSCLYKFVTSIRQRKIKRQNFSLVLGSRIYTTLTSFS
jgi:hypothetical protein